MKVCYFGTYDVEQSRNNVIIQGLRQNGVEVVECHVRLWRNTRAAPPGRTPYICQRCSNPLTCLSVRVDTSAEGRMIAYEDCYGR